MPTSAEYEKRHERILEHVALHRLLLPPCVTSTFSFGKPIPHVLAKLAGEGLLEGFPRSLPGGNSYYTLSPKGCVRIGAPVSRAAPLHGSAMDQAIAVSVFCHLDKHRRYRLTSEEADALFETAMPTNVVYVVSSELGTSKVFRVVFAMNQTAAESVRTVRVLLDQTKRHPKLAPWLESQQLGLAVLGTTRAAAAALEKGFAKSGLRTECPVIVGLGPDAESLTAAFKGKGK